ncbi:histidine kinase [Actibacterium mucosum KCTC 23349]|uniref:Histidine kinase n=1 Tax=Actibacterium mucosum KCTC 23349 TaxID=1454373 RepID=A0A037ZCI3_9RHOB|nr:histidine kinase [Actibacterium mucosum KCTC 23349]
MNGKLVAGALVSIGLIAGAAMYYLQVYGYYEPVADTGDNLRLTSIAGVAEPVIYDNFQAIDADSSPLRYRACFTTDMSQAMLTETFQLYENPTPLTTAGWFDCYDPAAIDAALKDGTATAYLGEANIVFGIDRVVAIFDDGRGRVWHQINACGKEHYDGNPVPAGCPPPPEDN